MNTETITTGKLQAGDIIQDINPLTKEVTHHTVQFVKEYTAPTGAKMWRVSLSENDKFGWVSGASKRYYRVTN